MSALELIATVVILLLLALGIIAFFILYQRRIIRHQSQLRNFQTQKRLELMQASIESEEAVRMRIATELHDDVGATLSSIRLFLTQAEQTVTDPKLIVYSKSLLDESIRKVRSLSHQLQPRTIQYLGLLKALESLATMLTETGAIRVDYLQEGYEWPQPDVDVSLAVYRIVQEWINNTLKYAGATHIQIRAHFEEGHSCIGIYHDGSRLTEAAYQEQLYKKNAIGLKNIEMRLKAAGLFLLFPTEKDNNSFIKICLPKHS